MTECSPMLAAVQPERANSVAWEDSEALAVLADCVGWEASVA